MGNDSGTLVALDVRTGALTWTFRSPGTPGSNGFTGSSALIDARGTVHIQNQYGVFAFTRRGALVWYASSLAGYGTSLASGTHAGTAYVVANAGTVAPHAVERLGR